MGYDDQPNANGDHFKRSPLDAPVTHPDVSVRKPARLLTRSRLVATVTGGALVAILVVAVFHAGFPITTSVTPVATAASTPDSEWTPLPTQTLASFPAFSSWRALYLRIEGRLHAISPDGAQDAAGPTISTSLAPQIGGPAGGGMSPDGGALTYIANGTLVVGSLRVTGGASPTFTSIDGPYFQAFWSPDSSMIAICNPNSLTLVHMADLRQTAIPLQAHGDTLNLLGWIDGSHLAVVRQGSASPTYTLGSVHIEDGAFRLLATLPVNIGATLALSPDGTQVLDSAVPVRDQTFAPFVDVISTASGQRRHLSTISAAVPRGIDSLAWKPGSSLIAVTTQRASTSGAKQLFLLDVARDTATSVPARLPYALGWVPGDQTLIMGDWQPGSLGLFAPHLLDALIFPSTGAPSEILLTDQVVGPFFGFIRTE